MKKNHSSFKKIGLIIALLLFNLGFSQNETNPVVDTTKTTKLEDIVITGVANPKAKIKSSVSITTLDVKQVEQSAPRSTAEIFRSIPGIRSESSGGEGNSNISVRGVPISSGGSKYLQIQEDGLPVLLFGDIAFATADIFTRFDGNTAKIEAIRGGSASTLSSNSPGGIINFISKTGKTEGGMIRTSFGLDYNNFRTDVDYGTKIGEGLYFHAGGFYRAGEGVRKTGSTSNNGGQVKFNLTKEFENGKITVYAKFLNDRAAAYMPMPVKVTGTNSNPTWGSVSGFDATTGALQSIYLNHNVGLGPDGGLWGGELLRVDGATCERIGHLKPLALPGGDRAAREPWRMAAAALHRLGLSSSTPLGADAPSANTLLSLTACAHIRAGTLAPIPATSLKAIASMLARGLNCPSTTSAGRWFDAVAGLLGVCWWQTEEAQAAIALEQLAAQWLSENAAPVLDAELVAAGLNLDVLLRRLLSFMADVPGPANSSAATHEASQCATRTDTTDQAARPVGVFAACRPEALVLAAQSEASALFHVALADALAQAAIQAAQQHQISAIALSGGCFFNRILRGRMQDTLTQAGLTAHLPTDRAFGDAGLALGQAWVAAHSLQPTRAQQINTQQATTRNSLCV